MLAFLIPFLIIGCASTNRIAVDEDQRGRDLRSSLRVAAKKSGFDVDIVTDAHGIPHLAGTSDQEIYFSQGFVHAYYRINQMEVISRTIEGTRSELAGVASVGYDENSLLLGLDRVAVKVNEKIRADAQTRVAVDAYVAGVNAWVSQVPDDLLSIEFRTSKKRPRLFQSIDVARVLTFISWSLHNPSDELKLSRTRAGLTAEVFETLFPWPGSDASPGVFNSTFKIAPRKAPRVPITIDDVPIEPAENSPFRVPPNTGSNAFVTPASRNAGRSSFLAQDFHTSYALPSLFIPMQLVSNSFNAIGSSIPGMPGLATGTNGFVAWAYVSSMSDSFDWYRLETDSKRPDFYRWNGRWIEFESEAITIRPFDSKPITFIRRRSEAGEMVPAFRSHAGITELAYRWTGRDGPNFLLPFLRRMTIRSAKECGIRESLENSAAYLLTCVDQDNARGVWLMSRLPRRPLHQDPRVVMAATGSKDIWTTYFSGNSNPADFPRQTDVVLANQFSRSRSREPYVGWLFNPPDRANRITSLLTEANGTTEGVWDYESVRAVLSDITSARVEAIRPTFISIARRYVDEDASEASLCARSVLEKVEAWDGKFEASSHQARLMNYWLYRTEQNVWSNVIGPEEGRKWPQGWVIVDLILKSPKSPFWDQPSTREKEDRDKIVRRSLEDVCQRFFQDAKGLEGNNWGAYSKPSFRTLNGIRFPNSFDLAPGGSGTTVFLQDRTMGSIYRSIVALDKKVRFWTIAVGGIDGNAASPQSGNWFSVWADRKMLESKYMSRDEIRKTTDHD